MGGSKSRKIEFLGVNVIFCLQKFDLFTAFKGKERAVSVTALVQADFSNLI